MVRFLIGAALLTLMPHGAMAQDVPGIEICTAEKTMERRTGCLQSNVNFLKAEGSAKGARREVTRAAARYSMSSPRRRGPITTGRNVREKFFNHPVQTRRQGVWVPAFAGTTCGGFMP